jgi:hypothetical protein
MAGFGGHWTKLSGRCTVRGGGARGAFSLWSVPATPHAPRPPRQWAGIRWRRMVTERLEEDFILDLTSSREHAFLHDQTSTIDGLRIMLRYTALRNWTRVVRGAITRPPVLEGQCSLLRCRLFPEA